MIQSDNNSDALHPDDASPEETLRRLKAKNRKAIRRRASILILAILTVAGFEWRHDLGVWGIGRWKLLGSGEAVGVKEALRRVYEQHAILLDVRDSREYEVSHVVGARHLALETLRTSGWPADWPTNRPVVVYCTVGERGGIAASILESKGLNASCIVGGIIALARTNEPLECEAGTTWQVWVGESNYGWMLPKSYEAVRR